MKESHIMLIVDASTIIATISLGIYFQEHRWSSWLWFCGFGQLIQWGAIARSKLDEKMLEQFATAFKGSKHEHKN